ncbi:PAS/PAC sensor signal transduction histidine kinase [Sulfitobacter noctilucicola]|uniref:histidine kinase n=1 Tax=Sulfitobacter noctilucicola TaxID=1342301 RepID=A0A7W6M6H8_9RHOB|nr:PAS domain-containing sensor histidine kinase [Sulfitobacter noctilucicola]KIN62153.1 PAS/PAC sensor signal transduction histidine kinase [Sulfitobacter noctilucicola]MBB4173329.1 hypothetical protein [Sulfitobacter noctilucicola]
MQHDDARIQKADDILSAQWASAPFLKKVTDIVPNVIYVFNQKTQSNEYTNRSLGTALGYSEQEVRDLGADLMPHICHPQDLPRIFSHFEGLQSLIDDEVKQVDYRVRHKQGHWVWLLSQDRVFERAPDGSVLRHIGVASDISAQKAAEEHARSEQRKAEITSAELRDFSYSMSHDMKSPSSTLHLLLSELIDSHGDTLDEDAASLVYMSLTTVTRLSKLVDDVLHYTRVVDHDLHPEAVDLSLIVKDVLGDLHGIIKHGNSVVEVGYLPVVMADKRQMRILFQCLIENAIKFHTPGRSAKVQISSSALVEDRNFRITIADDGIGIDRHKHEQIFTIFKRLNAENDFVGSGLGLAICRRIAANHQTDITVDSAPGEGSAFSIGLPQA